MAAVIVPAIVPEIDQLEQILEWIEFSIGHERANIIQDAFTTYADLQSMK